MQTEIRKSILIVEEDICLAKSTEKTLRSYGYEVLIAETGETAVKSCCTNLSPNLILMGIDFSIGIDGIEATQKILEIKHVPILFHVDSIEKEYTDRVKGLPYYGFVLKNSQDHVLTSAIEMAIELFEVSQNKETELQENESLLNKAQEIAQLGSWSYDLITNKLKWTDEHYRILGLKPGEFNADYDTFLTMIHPDDLELVRSEFAKSLIDGKNSYVIEYRVIRKDNGQIRSVIGKCEHIRDLSGNVIRSVGTMQDITERKLTEAKIQALLREKELILKEVHHRIKNNMNTINALLTLQAGRLSDPPVKAVLKDAASRVQSMMVLYDKLYQSAGFKTMSIQDYLPALVDQIIKNFPNSDIVKIEKDIEDCVLSAEKLSPLGIIINELLTNIMKYAFIDKEEGLIRVSSSVKGDRVSLVIQDNGNGIPDSIDFENTPGFGLMLVGLLTKQIDGTIRKEFEKGTKITVEFDK